MDKPDLTLYLGGTRSGKSARAEARVFQRADGPVLYVATAEARPDDPSMTERIRRHRARRPENWRTLECPLQLGEHIGTALAEFRNTAGTPTVLLDCITLWVSNILFSLPDPRFRGCCAPRDGSVARRNPLFRLPMGGCFRRNRARRHRTYPARAELL